MRAQGQLPHAAGACTVIAAVTVVASGIIDTYAIPHQFIDVCTHAAGKCGLAGGARGCLLGPSAAEHGEALRPPRGGQNEHTRHAQPFVGISSIIIAGCAILCSCCRRRAAVVRA